MSPADSSWIKNVSLAPPCLQDNTADAERLITALRAALQTDESIHIDFSLIKNLPDILRRSDFSVRCILFYDGHRWLVHKPGTVDRVYVQFPDGFRPIRIVERTAYGAWSVDGGGEVVAYVALPDQIAVPAADAH